MCNDERGFTFGQLPQATLDGALGLGVNGAGSFVENEYRSVLKDGACKAQALSLSAGELDAALTNDGIVAIG